MRFPGLIAGGATITLLAAVVAATIAAGDESSPPDPATTARVTPPLAPGASRLELALSHVEGGFASSYGAYLDGAPIGALRDASITATAQARSGGRIPAAFRDGSLSVASASTSSGPFSAQATIVLANREERYPLALQLLRQQRGWQVAQLEPPDLTMDETVRPSVGVIIPTGAQGTTRRFALAYAAFRAGVGSRPGGMTSAATRALSTGQDTLSEVRLPAHSPRLVALSYGPLNDGEFAATATVRFGTGAEQQFSLLMQLRKQTGEWLCAAFL